MATEPGRPKRRAVPIIPYLPFPSGTVQVAAGGITAASIATDAIGSDEFSQAAADKVWTTAARALTDKAGFTLTAGSYSVRASSTQRGTVLVNGATSNSLAVSSVTMTRAQETFMGHTTSQTTSGLDVSFMRGRLSSSTAIVVNTAANGNQDNMDVVLQEIF